MTTPDFVATRQDFREALSGPRAGDNSLAVADAVRASRSNAQSRLRAFTGVSALLRDYGATMPEPIVEAQALMREARLVATEFRVGDPMTYARQAVASGDLRKGIAAAAKERAKERDAAEIASHVFEAAAERVLSTVSAHADEIADAVLSSDVLARAFEEVARYAERVPASTRRSPDLDRDGAASVANVAHLRAASDVFDQTLVRLVASGIVSDPDRDGAAALLFARSDGAAPDSVRRGVRGIRPGVPDINVWTSSAVSAPAARPFAEAGIPAAILWHTPGVVFEPATTVRDFDARLASLHGVTAPAMMIDGERVSGAGLVL